MRTISRPASFALSACACLFILACQTPRITAPDLRSDLPESFVAPLPGTDTFRIDRKLFSHSPLLDDLLDTVLAHNPDYAIALQRIRAAQAAAGQARGLLRPQVNLVGSPSLRKFGRHTMDGAGNIVTDMEPGRFVPIDLPDLYGGFQASWEVDLWGKLSSRSAAALARRLASTEGRRLLRTQLVAETSSAYYELLSYDQELQLLDETIRLQEEALDLARVQQQAAIVNRLAVLQFEAQLVGQRALRQEVRQLVVDTEARIRILLGGWNRPIRRDTSFFTQLALPALAPGTPAEILRNRPDVRQAEWEVEAAQADLKAARAGLLPNLNLTSGLGLQAYRAGLLFRLPEAVAYSLVAGLAGPVVNRAQLKGEYEKADAQRAEAVLAYRRTLTRAFLEVQQEWQRVGNLAGLYDLKRRERDIQSEAVGVALELFRYGRANYVEVLMVRQNALRTAIEVIDARRRQYQAAIALYRALGGG
jgi:NodT family efflux transporter outer membrane factor (OMF) lipoprotein